MAQRVLQLHQLNKQIMLGIKSGSAHGRLKVEAQPLLDSQSAQLLAALRQVEKQHQIKHQGRGQNRVAAQEINLDLHGIAQPSEDIDVVPALFVIATRRVIIDANLVGELAVKLGIKLRLQDVLQHRQLGLL